MAPELLVADEPVSALDVSLQGQIINLLQELNAELGLTIVLISHDLAVVARVCSALAVMSRGQVVEEGIPQQVLRTPRHAYTQSLLAAVPRGLDGRRRRIEQPLRRQIIRWPPGWSLRIALCSGPFSPSSLSRHTGEVAR